MQQFALNGVFDRETAAAFDAIAVIAMSYLELLNHMAMLGAQVVQAP